VRAELIAPTHPEMTGSPSAFRLHGYDGVDPAAAMSDHYKITVPISRNVPNRRIHVSGHIYNMFAQIDRLVAALDVLRPRAHADP